MNNHLSSVTIPAERTPVWLRCIRPLIMSDPADGQADNPSPRNVNATWRSNERKAPRKRTAEERIADFREIYSLFDEEEVKRQASRCLQCGVGQCVEGCPLSNRIPEWLALAAAGKFLEAARVSQSTSNLPEICSRVCPQERLCEGACVLNIRSDAVAIGAIEQFINEYAFAHEDVSTVRATPNGFRVAVIGAGPAGLACADQLAQLGYGVAVFEAFNRAGGLLVHGIPAFKLEKEIVERRVEILRRRGVSFNFGVRIGKDRELTDLLTEFDAVFWGVGAQKPKSARVPGDKLPGVYDALPFLTQKNVDLSLGFEPIDVSGKRVAVLGGGDTAMDCLRTAIRAGASEAICLYRRDLANMPGSRKEYQNATEEGARFHFLTNPTEITAGPNGRLDGVRCVRMQLGEPDASGRRRPESVPGSETIVPADVVLVAYGFDPVPVPPTALGEIKTNEWGGLVLDDTGMTSLPGLFAGGDAFRGPSLVAEAVRDGRCAATGIHQFVTSRNPSSRASASKPSSTSSCHE